MQLGIINAVLFVAWLNGLTLAFNPFESIRDLVKRYTSNEEINQLPILSPASERSHRHRIAIIGAGAGGASTAYHLSQFIDSLSTSSNGSSRGQVLEIDIFESNPYVGGRTTTVNALDDPRYPTELGASIFVTVNHILYNLTRDFGLSTRDRTERSTGAIYDVGIWDGSSFVFSLANDDSDEGSWRGRWQGYWDIVKLLWKYGLSPVRVQRTTKSVVSNFLRMYDEYFPISSLDKFVHVSGLWKETGMTGKASLLAHGVSEEFARDIVQSSTRVNYAQNLNSIHGLETFVCMAIEGAMSIDGGNWQIFDEAVKRSGANLHLNTTVKSVSETEQGTYQITTEGTSHQGDKEPYDAIILAAPYQHADIAFTPPISPEFTPEKIDYVHLHVTLFTSPYRPSPAYFGLDSQDQVPDSVLTTLPTDFDPAAPGHQGANGTGPSKFWSLSTLGVLDPAADALPPNLSDEDLVTLSKTLMDSTTRPRGRQYLYKIFSPVPVTGVFLAELFGWDLADSPQCPGGLAWLTTTTTTNPSTKDPLSHCMPPSSTPIPYSQTIYPTLPPSLVSWSYAKLWQSYPYLPPTTSFAPLLLAHPLPGYVDWFTRVAAGVVAAPRPDNARGVWYTGGVESFISTMETSALMGRNVARIVADGVAVGTGPEDA